MGHKSTVDLTPEQAMAALRLDMEQIEARFEENPNDPVLLAGIAEMLEAFGDMLRGGPDRGSYNYRVSDGANRIA